MKWLVGILIVPILLFVGYTALVLHWSFSTGERAGYLLKFSKKGWICKTWEGELTMTALPGATPEKFIFTVRDDAVAAQMNKALGQKVRVSYNQHRGIPTNCFGDTEYFGTKIETIP